MLFSWGCVSPRSTGNNSTNGDQTEVNIRQFGAIPDDGRDDSDAIQAAIDYAIYSGKISIVRMNAGIFDVHKGIVIANQDQNKEYQFVSLQLAGNIPSFSSEQRFGATTVLRYHDSGFALAIQSARNCQIENIVFEGNGIVFNEASGILEAFEADWKQGGKIRTDPYSPHAAIAIDPFHQHVGAADRYPGFNQYYSNISNGGSSMLTIKGCAFHRFYIAIANNPSNGVSNGDNIRAEQCYVENCHTFWAAGQTQSRNNSIENVYALYLHTFVSGVEIGQKQGTPPFISNVNIAGFCKYVFNVRTLFSGLWMKQSYMESIWSLGIAVTNAVSFDQCQIQFKIPSSDIFAPPFYLFSAGTVTFRDCGIEFFNNCKSPVPMVMRAGALQIIGGWIEGGIITGNGITNAGGDEIHNVSFQNVFLKCQGGIAGRTSFDEPIQNLANDIFLGGESKRTNDHMMFTNTGKKYHVYSLGEVELQIDQFSKSASFLIKNVGLIKTGDNIFSVRPWSLDPYGIKGGTIQPALGYVSSIHRNEVTIENIPHGIKGGTMELYIVEYPVFIAPMWGNVTLNSSTITDIITYSSSFFPVEGARIFLEGFPIGTYVVESNPMTKSIKVSSSAFSSSKERFIRNATYNQDVSMDAWSPHHVSVLIEGATIQLQQPFNSNYRFVNTTKAVLNTAHKATLKPIE